MAKGFGEDLWRNAQAVRLDNIGALQAPVRADGRRGIVVGLDRVDAGAAQSLPTSPAPSRFGVLVRRLARRS